MILKSGLDEELKWSMPCYTYQGKNILLMSAYKEFACLAFFKGSLLSDKQKLLVSAGANSNAVRQLRFTSLAQVKKTEKAILQYIKEAIDLEIAGKKVAPLKDQPLQIIPELGDIFKTDKKLETAFYNLTHGRQRGYLLFFSEAKQSETRRKRIEKYYSKIISGKGFHD